VSAAANISTDAQDARIRRGVITVSGTILLTVVLLQLEVPIIYRLIVFVPFLGALNLVYQGLFKT